MHPSRALSYFAAPRHLALAFLAALVLLGSAGQAAPDISTPKNSGVAFAKALLAGDMETLHQVALGTDAEFAILQGSTEMLRAMKRMEKATIAKFGEQGKLAEGVSIDNFVAEFEGAEEKIVGDKATLVLKSKPNNPHPPTFKKVAEGWKMDLSEISQTTKSKEMLKIVPIMVAAVDGVTKDVEAGKYKTAAEAKADMQGRMFGAMMAAAGGDVAAGVAAVAS